MSKKQYVLCYVESEGSVLLIEKLKPEWQRFKINLPGGSIEPGETPEQAAARELFEEANILAYHVEKIGVVEGSDWTVHVIRCISQHPEWWESKTNESVFWLPVRDALKHPKLISNLRTIIPLASLGVSDWTLTDDGQMPSRNFLFTFPCESPRTSATAA